jgi:hypothetical protein|tara:strand:+ start:217 stop:588 length:372 start_codon:yes stop_codon:yes gene_type:complete
MRFDELNEDNYVMFAIKHYENPHAVTQDDFYEDLKRFKWIKRLLKRYQTTGILKSHLLINHFIILYNVFGEAATPLLFFKIDRELWPVVKTFVVYLGRLPEYPRSALHDIPIDTNCLQDLDQI